MVLLKLLIAFAICLSLPITALAHPGRTDSNGGHTNRSTGEYHYHHGYPEHQHYDMDGDGTLDCKYKFANKTDSSKSKSNSSVSSPSVSSSSSNNASSKKKSFEEYALIVCGTLAAIGFVADLISDKKRKNKK